MQHENPTDQIRHILMTDWDPIGVRGVEAAADEYDSYIPAIRQMLSENKSVDDLARFLDGIEADRMGLTPDKDRSQAAALKLAAIPIDGS